MGFRERNGIGIREEMQIDSLDEGTRNLLYTVSVRFLDISDNYSIGKELIGELLSFKMAIILKDKLEKNNCYYLRKLYQYIMELEWYYTYEIIEAIYDEINGYDFNEENCISFVNYINNILENEKCNYRMNKEGKFIKVCNETEFESIEQTYSISKDSVKYHFKNAVMGYSKRGGDVNYHEVCNEAIKSVEAMVRQYLGKGYEKKTLGQCLDPFRQKIGIPKFIIDSISDSTEKNETKYFGNFILDTINYVWLASNNKETATRYSKPEDTPSAIGEPEAYYILITCSSFINYIYKTCSKKQ